MIKKFTLLLFIVLTPTLSYSYQCTMLMTNVDSAIMKIDEEAHDNGDHLLSEEILNAALRLLNI